MSDSIQKVIINFTNNTNEDIVHIGTQVMPGETDSIMIDYFDFHIQDIREFDSLGLTINSIKVETKLDIEKRVEESARRYKEWQSKPKPTYECPF